MTSVKYYSRWMKEAGRGHLSVLVSGGSFLLCACSMLIRLQIDTEYTFFGIGNGMEVPVLCAALGLLIGFSEFFYLLQERKLEFYYSLPVKKGIIFRARYLHGVFAGLIPLLLYMVVCGVYQGSTDGEFLIYAGGYTARSILVYSGIFLLFYHIAMFSVVVSGRIITAIVTVILVLCSAQVFIQNICLVFAENLYRTFYRIPVLERIKELLVPWSLGSAMSGGKYLFEKEQVWAFAPDKGSICALFVWIAVLFAVSMFIHEKRKAESVGKCWVTAGCERSVEILLSVSAGLWCSAFCLEVGNPQKKGAAFAACVMLVIGGLAVCIVHWVMEKWVLKHSEKEKHNKLRLIPALSVVCLGILCGTGVQPYFDGFLPEKDNLAELQMCMYGMDMNREEYQNCMSGKQSYLIDRQLERYTVSKDGLAAGMEWLNQLLNVDYTTKISDGQFVKDTQKSEGNTAEEWTGITVCYRMKNGAEKYRTYPVDKKSFLAFEDVFESGEYKEVCYPVWENEGIEDERFIWDDGVTKQVIKLADSDKAGLKDIYQQDVEELKFTDLQTAPPIGIIEIKSDKWGETKQVTVYPFFEHTCRFLEEHGIQTEKTLFDYPIRSIRMMTYEPTSKGYVGGTLIHSYKQAEEIEQWKGRLMPEEFDRQPLLFMTDGEIEESEAEIEEPESGAVIHVKCKALPEKRK